MNVAKEASFRRASSEYCVTVTLEPHELPPPPKAHEKFVTALKEAARWAPDLGEDLLDVIADLIHDAKRRTKAAEREAA